jgi:predicted Zn-dependent protease with MMP-like domain
MPSATRFTVAPSLDELAAIAEEALASIPEPLLRQVRNLSIQVEEFPDEATEHEMELETPFDILGLYRGVALPHQSVSDVRSLPELVSLYRRPILDEWCETGEDLTHLVRHVLIHEIGHHFGFSDEEMEALEAAAQEGRAGEG